MLIYILDVGVILFILFAYYDSRQHNAMQHTIKYTTGEKIEIRIQYADKKYNPKHDHNVTLAKLVHRFTDFLINFCDFTEE